NATVAVSPAAVFAALSLGPRLYGIAAYAEHFVLPPALAGTLVLLRALESSRPRAFLASGALFGLAVLVKQSGAAFGLFAVVYTLLSGVSPGAHGDWRRRFLPAGAVVAGALAPLALVGAVLAGAGVFDRFWFWTVTYALHYASAVPLTAGVALFAHKAGELLATSYLVAILAAVGVSALVWHPEARQRRAFVLLLALLSLGGTSAGLYFRNQYFVLLLPSVALFAGLGVDALAGSVARGTLRRGLAAALTVIPLVAFLFAERVILWEAPPERVTRELFGLSPFPESVEIARYLRSRTAEGERIAVIGSEPEIYFYAGRRGATGYVYMYPLMEDQPYASRMQRQMIDEIEAARPRFVVLVNASASWNARPQSDRTLFEWWARYVKYFGQLLLQGIPPYAQAYNFKMPGIYAVYALMLAAFGQTPAGIHLGLLVVNVVTIALLFLVVRRRFDTRVAVVAAVTFAGLSLSPRLLSTAAYAEHFVLPPVLAGLLVLPLAIDRRSLAAYLGSGALF